MGTSYSVQLQSLPANLTEHELSTQIVDVLEKVDAAMSTYRDDSELMRFNGYASTDWFPVSVAVANVVSEALHVSRLSDGAFDATVNPLVSLWGFGATGIRTTRPADRDIAAARARTGYQYLAVRLEPPALRKSIPDLSVDLSAIAKGYAVDRIAELIEHHGGRDYLVEIGGELRGRGNNLHNKPWRIGIVRPDPTDQQAELGLPLCNLAIATSGDYRNFFEADGQHYSHIIDSRTGEPVTHSLTSVTVLADNAMRADALATALLVMGPDVGFKLAARQNIPAMFIERDATAFKNTTSPAWQRYIASLKTVSSCQQPAAPQPLDR